MLWRYVMRVYKRRFDNLGKSGNTSPEVMTALQPEGWVGIEQTTGGESILSKVKTMYKGPLGGSSVYMKTEWSSVCQKQSQSGKVILSKYVKYNRCQQLQ